MSVCPKRPGSLSPVPCGLFPTRCPSSQQGGAWSAAPSGSGPRSLLLVCPLLWSAGLPWSGGQRSKAGLGVGGNQHFPRLSPNQQAAGLGSPPHPLLPCPSLFPLVFLGLGAGSPSRVWDEEGLPVTSAAPASQAPLQAPGSCLRGEPALSADPPALGAL